MRANSDDGLDGASVARRIHWRTTRRLRTRWQCRDLTADDALLVSYPRSGSLWMRFLLVQLLRGPSTFEEVHDAVPYVGLQRAGPRLLPAGGRLIKTHDRYMAVYRRALYLVRDPRDVAVSYYKFLQRNGTIRPDPQVDPKVSFERYLDSFFAGRLDPHGDWQTHVRSWLGPGARARSDVHQVRFEDLRQDPGAVLTNAAEWLDLPYGPDDIRAAVERSDISRLRTLVAGIDARWNSRTGNQAGMFSLVNEGGSGRWQRTLTPEQAARFASFHHELALMGYETA